MQVPPEYECIIPITLNCSSCYSLLLSLSKLVGWMWSGRPIIGNIGYYYHYSRHCHNSTYQQVSQPKTIYIFQHF